MPTPSIQTLRADAQQVLNLDSISAVRSVVAATLANANAGTPLNPNLTTQQLWNEFYQIVTQPKSDIESIIANQLMKFLYAPPAPGGAGADKQVIFNDGGVLAGDPQFLWNKTTNLLTVTGSATITGDLTVDTSTLKVDSTNNRVTVGTTSAYGRLTVGVGSGLQAGTTTNVASGLYDIDYATTGDINTRFSFVNSNGVTNAAIDRIGNPNVTDSGNLAFLTRSGAGSLTERYRIASDGVATWSNVGGVAGTAMTLNSTGLGVGASPANDKILSLGSMGILLSGATSDFSFRNSGGTAIQRLRYTDATGTLTIGSATVTSFPVELGGNTTTRAVTIDASSNVGVGVAPITGHRISSVGPIGLSGGPNSFLAVGNYCSIYYTDGSGSSFPFLEYGNLVIHPRDARNVVIATAPSAGSNTSRIVVKTNGQVRFVPLAADPSGAEAGDVYYNSVSNRLKYYNGTAWTLI